MSFFFSLSNTFSPLFFFLSLSFFFIKMCVWGFISQKIPSSLLSFVLLWTKTKRSKKKRWKKTPKKVVETSFLSQNKREDTHTQKKREFLYRYIENDDDDDVARSTKGARGPPVNAQILLVRQEEEVAVVVFFFVLFFPRGEEFW